MEETFMEEQVRKAIEDVRPSLQADGGDVKFISVSPEGVVSVELQGACNGCPMAQLTLKQGIERYLKDTVPGVTSVESV
jgi:Fe-S cluster biogenesis protein NfuA